VRPSKAPYALSAVLGIAVFVGPVHLCQADDAKPAGSEAGTGASKANEKSTSETLTGLGLGVGLSVTWDTVQRQRVDEAVVDANGIVRANKTSNVLARIMLESHYFFTRGDQPRFGVGPFVAIEPGISGDLINTIGAGIMVGFRRREHTDKSFNLGVGYGTDPQTKVLGDEFQIDKPAPLGPEGKPLPIRFVTRDQGGWIILASFAW
jgi:hypothetical protein